MSKRVVIDHQLLQIKVERICQQLMEHHGDLSNVVILGLQPRGIKFAERIKSKLKQLLKKDIPLGYLDTTFHRDDFRRSAGPLKANATNVPFLIEDRNVILVDDVLFTGRSVRAGLDAMLAFGRPRNVELLVLVDRKYSRDLPVQAHYVGVEVNCMESEHVVVEWANEGSPQDSIYLTKKNKK